MRCVLLAALDAHVAVLIYNKMAEKDGSRFIAQAQAALFSAPQAVRQASRKKRAFPPGMPDQVASPTGTSFCVLLRTACKLGCMAF